MMRNLPGETPALVSSDVEAISWFDWTTWIEGILAAREQDCCVADEKALSSTDGVLFLFYSPKNTLKAMKSQEIVVQTCG